MKAEINNENKGKFFALYWGQEVYGWEDGLTTGFVSLNVDETEFLTLKPLSSISDEDAIDVAKLDTSVDWTTESNPSIWKNTFDITVVSNGSGLIQKYGQTLIGLGFLTPSQFDLLRSRGYALPWMGLSVEEMVEAGWIKLTE